MLKLWKLSIWVISITLTISLFALKTEAKSPQEKPNILWLVCEDISPYLGCYGCKEAYTPNLDKLAENGVRFTHAYANGPVCAVARSTILSGMHATSTGTHQMRGRQIVPSEIPAYPKILMESGYYCTNNAKTDYNSNFEFEKHSLWDETSNTAHWKNRPEGKPFFAVFNIGCTHEGQISAENIPGYIKRGEIPEKTRINPEDIELPPYHPDLPEVRQDWARLHDMITRMDEISGAYLQELEDEGVDDNTIVFFYSDHGGQLSRSKRFVYNNGTQVPFIVYLPEKWKHLTDTKPGEPCNDLVSFVDFAKTSLSITGCDVPEIMQGHIFLGKNKETAPQYVHLYRNRMDEQIDFSRAVNDGRYHFIRNFLPNSTQGRQLYYPYNVQANWGAWAKHYDAGKCNEVQGRFFNAKPVLQLFDIENDRWEVNNLATKPEHQKRVKEMSEELDRWMIETRDIGLIPEAMYFELIGTEKKYKTLYEYAQSDAYEIERILEVAKTASLGEKNRISEYLLFMKDENPIVRYWGAYGVFLTKSEDDKVLKALKQMAQNDNKTANRLMAAQSLGLQGERDFAFELILKEIETANYAGIVLAGLNALQFGHLDDMLTKEMLLKIKNHSYPRNLGIDQTVAGNVSRMLDDAIKIFPERRKVD